MLSARSSARRLVGRLLQSVDDRVQRNRLHAASDHLLRDMGIARDQIDEAFSGRLDPASRR